MTLSEKQRQFTRKLARLLDHINSTGYECTIGDAYRDPRVHGDFGKSGGYGAVKSCHKLRLAVDLNLFRDGVYLTDTADYLSVGEYWESIGGSWGGRFSDGNHFSLEWDGCR